MRTPPLMNEEPKYRKAIKTTVKKANHKHDYSRLVVVEYRNIKYSAKQCIVCEKLMLNLILFDKAPSDLPVIKITHL